MKIGEVEKIGTRELPGVQVPTFNPRRQDQPAPTPAPAAPVREKEKVPAD